MKHLGTKTLTTKRLILRPFVEEDAEAMFRNWAGDGEVTRFLTWPAHKSPEDSRTVLKQWQDEYQKDDTYQWAIVPRSLGEPVGSISVVNRRDDIGMVEVGYCIGKAWWHQGVTSEALSAVIRFLFRKVGVNRIESRHDPRNPNSGKVMAKCGLLYEGTARQADKNNQGVCDYCRYALLAEDYAQDEEE